MRTGTAKTGEPALLPFLIAVTGKGAGQKELGASGTCGVAGGGVWGRRSGSCVPMGFCEPREGVRLERASGLWGLGFRPEASEEVRGWVEGRPGSVGAVGGGGRG